MWPRADSRAEPRQAAVIDVGSNSVRLVIYRLDGRAIWTVYNEKALAGLGRDLPATGRLSPEGVEVALTAHAPLPRPAGRLAAPRTSPPRPPPPCARPPTGRPS